MITDILGILVRLFFAIVSLAIFAVAIVFTIWATCVFIWFILRVLMFLSPILLVVLFVALVADMCRKR